MVRKISLVLGILAALMLPSETFAKHGGGGHGGGHAVATCIMGDTVTAGVVTCTMVMVGQAMPITDPLMARVMVAPATVMRIMDMAGGITVTGTPAMAVGGVAAGTLMVLEPVGVLGQQ